MDLLTIVMLMAAIGVYIMSLKRDKGEWDLKILAILLAVGSIVSAILTGDEAESGQYITIMIILINFYIIAASIVSLGGRDRWPRRIRCPSSRAVRRLRASAIRR